MAKPRWIINEQLSQNQKRLTVRQLLQQQWYLPSRFIHYLRVRKQVLVNGSYRNMNELVTPGDQVTLNFYGNEFRTPSSNYLPTAQAHLAILFENRDLLVVNKPAGQKTHPNQPFETGTLMNDVAGYLKDGPNAAYMVHRIDQATSGAVIVAKNPVVVPILDRYIAEGRIHRRYLAVVTGNFAQSMGQFTWPIGFDSRDRRKRQVDGVAAKPAITNYQVLRTVGNLSLVRLQLQTGRTHQIRVHLAYSGHPIVGDPLYGGQTNSRMLLHGANQQLVMPFKGTLKEISAPVPNYFPDALVKYEQKE
ncbi:RluA family pseudouridine synthase [uncultured Limosilactobacillus sp.]|uniref:RluA family pseudouridine synthase n=1 Tax=uncultured Limosilactobacillus sp. TaxID=2837629 RepID=UPI0025EB8422|nr:RluA family pseudouridine synthase [uncultured Limosilactobacillus sp.]